MNIEETDYDYDYEHVVRVLHDMQAAGIVADISEPGEESRWVLTREGREAHLDGRFE